MTSRESCVETPRLIQEDPTLILWSTMYGSKLLNTKTKLIRFQKKEIMESAGSSSGDANSASARRDSYIPPVPRVPSIYSRQNVGRGRGTGSGRLPPPRRPAPRPPVSYNHQRNGSVLPHPDPLRSTPTVAGFGLTASASTNDLVQPTRAASGSHFPVSDHNSPRIPSHSSRNQPRDSMFIRQPKPLHEIEQTLRPITYLPEENTNSSFSTSTSTPRTNGDSKSDHKKRSPKHQRSFLGLKKAATDSSNPSQASEPPDSIRSKGSRFQLRKTPSRIMNLDQVAKGVAPVTGDTQIAAVLSNDQLSASVENQPTAKRQRSRFQLRKTPTNIPAPKTSKQPDQAEMDHTTSIEESMLSQDKSSVLKEDPSFRRQSNNRGTSKPSPKQYRSLFNLRKTPTGVPQLSSGLSPKHHSQVSGPTMPSPRQYRPTVNPSTTNLQPTSPTRIPTPVAPALDNKSRYFSEPVKSSQKEVRFSVPCKWQQLTVLECASTSVDGPHLPFACSSSTTKADAKGSNIGHAFQPHLDIFSILHQPYQSYQDCRADHLR